MPSRVTTEPTPALRATDQSSCDRDSHSQGDDSEDDTVGAAAGPLLYTAQVLRSYVAQSKKVPNLQPNGKPLYVLTTGAVGAGKEYIPFDVSKLNDTDLDASGVLRKGRLFLGSMLPSDRVRGMQRVEAPKYEVRLRAGKRGVGKDERPIYESFCALVDKHRKRVQAPTGTPNVPSKLVDKGMQVHAWAGIFAHAAAVAQQVTLPSSLIPHPSPLTLTLTLTHLSPVTLTQTLSPFTLHADRDHADQAGKPGSDDARSC